MIKVAVVRGKYLNNFEMQSYPVKTREISITGISSYFPIHTFYPFPVNKLFSISDISSLPLIRSFPVVNKGIQYISNRAIGDSQILFWLEKYANMFDLFHAADPHYYYSYQLACLRKENKIKKLVVTSWETIPHNNETVKRKKNNKYFVYRYTDYFICYTNKAREVLIAEGVDKNKIEVITLGVNLSRFAPDRRNSNIITVLFVGRLVDEKGISDLYFSFKNAKNQIGEDYKLHLRIIGEGPLNSKLHDWVKKDNLVEHVSIAKADYEHIDEEYRNADICVIPSRHTSTWEEQYGMVLVEALASGLPTVAYDSGVITEIVGDTGIVIPEGDTTILTDKIVSLIQNKELRHTLSLKARERAERIFDSRKTAERLSKIYQNILSI